MLMDPISRLVCLLDISEVNQVIFNCDVQNTLYVDEVIHGLVHITMCRYVAMSVYKVIVKHTTNSASKKKRPWNHS